MSVLAREPRSLRPSRHLIDRAVGKWKLTPRRITLIYVLFGSAALYFSDVYLVQRVSEPLLGQLQALKGGVEVLLTGVLIFGLTATKEAQVDRSHERIDRQREELLVLHRVLRHNMRNDLNVILGSSESFTDEERPPEVRRRGERLQNTAEKMLHYTEQAGRIRRLTARDERTVEMDLTDVLPSLLEEHPRTTDDVDVSVDLPESAVVRVNHMFVEAIEELVENAIAHSGRERPRVDVTVDRSGGPVHLVECRVSDNGPGIPQQVIAILRRSESDQLTHLQGMGLWFVYWVVSESGGHIVIEESDAGGAAVVVRVPAEKIVSREHLEGVLNWRTRSAT